MIRSQDNDKKPNIANQVGKPKARPRSDPPIQDSPPSNTAKMVAQAIIILGGGRPQPPTRKG